MNKNKNMNRGAAILSLIFALLFFVLFSRFFYIQATGKVDGQVLAVKAEEKYKNQVTLEASRGKILDRNGEVLAQDTSTFTVVAVLDESLTTNSKQPRHVVDKEETARKLAPLLDMNEQEILSVLKKDRKQVEFGAKGRNISFSKKQEIEALELPGIAFIRDTNRFYPNGDFASYIIGFAQREKNKTEGKLGVEKYLDKYLQESDGYVQYEKDHYGFKLPTSDEKIVAPDNGADVYLTIDQKIQTFLEDAMNEAAEEYNPKKMIAIVANPKTGEILAMSQRPSFDPNKRNIFNYYNDAISYPFEPGSTMKIFTLAAAINEGVYNGKEAFQSGSYPVKGSKPINDHNYGKGWGMIPFDEGVQRSSNVAFSILAKEKLGFESFYQYIERFGLTKKTGIDLPGEATSRINYKYERDKLSTAYGQASSITPIQQIQGATAVAGDGKMMKPFVIDKVVDPDTKKTILDHKPKVAGEPISKDTAKKVRDLLETVVSSENGTGQAFQIEGYEVAGKTGTAQIAGSDGRYLTGRENYIFSFLGMAPKDDPELLMYVAVQQPELKPTETGSAPVSFIFKTVMKNGLEYLQVKPDHQPKRKSSETDNGFSLQDYTNERVENVEKQMAKQNIEVITLGEGKTIIGQFPFPETRVIANEKLLLRTEGHAKMPNVIGWSLRDVLKLSTICDLNLRYEGKGYVTAQSIKAGSALKKGATLTIKLDEQTKHRSEAEKEKNDKESHGEEE
ncbi:penicillin-binding protein [Bacillus sp. FJAT-47783]|uniref:penicillin-binding protein n=1 Tax=Bacillus sp. FJAT-47783 TaxID=2922712 RepID=UPI001FAC28F7|nr:penicillin-binding protein [Bacillus sp. FJAT-47783]